MTIKIAHLYYDLLNLYGENGNITALKNAFSNQNVDTEIDYLTVDDKKNLSKYDLIYIGSGSDDNLIIALNDLKKDIKQIKDVVEKGTYFIATGNAKELFGKSFEIQKEKIDALNIFDYYAKENSNHISGESLMEFEDLSYIIGFQNRGSVIQSNQNHLFKVVNGFADNFKSNNEGYRENNFFGTYLIGPLLIRNPHLTDYIVKDILTKKKITYKEVKDTFEHRAYLEHKKNFYQS